jgi:acyl carrier protein
MEVEKTFNTSISDEAMDEIQTIDDLVLYVSHLIQQ